MWQDGTSPALQSGGTAPLGPLQFFRRSGWIKAVNPKRGPIRGDFALTKEHKTEKGKFLFSFSWGEVLHFVCFSSPSSIRVWHRAYRLLPAAPPPPVGYGLCLLAPKPLAPLMGSWRPSTGWRSVSGSQHQLPRSQSSAFTWFGASKGFTFLVAQRGVSWTFGYIISSVMLEEWELGWLTDRASVLVSDGQSCLRISWFFTSYRTTYFFRFRPDLPPSLISLPW